ncbi:MAG: hypothetical protein ACLT2T_11855 [Bilophila wadsworthia]
MGLKWRAAGKHRAGGFRRRSAPLLRLAVQTASKAFLDAWFSPRKDLYAVPDDVAVCRCGNVSAADIREAVRDGLTDIKLSCARGHGQLRGWDLRPGSGGHCGGNRRRAIPDMGRLHVRSPAARAAFRPPAASRSK